jgi:hypothetical protein
LEAVAEMVGRAAPSHQKLNELRIRAVEAAGLPPQSNAEKRSRIVAALTVTIRSCKHVIPNVTADRDLEQTKPSLVIRRPTPGGF